MMDRKPQTPRMRSASVQPHRLHHHPGRRIEPALRRVGLRCNQPAQLRFVETIGLYPPKTRTARNRATRRDLNAPFPRSAARRILRRCRKPQPQRVVMIEQR